MSTVLCRKMPIHLCNCNYVSHLNLQLNVCGRADCGKCRYHILTRRKNVELKKQRSTKKSIFLICCIYFILFFFHQSATSPLSAMLNWLSAPTLTTTPTVYSAILPCLVKKNIFAIKLLVVVLYIAMKISGLRICANKSQKWMRVFSKTFCLHQAGYQNHADATKSKNSVVAEVQVSLYVGQKESTVWSADFFSPVGSSFFPRWIGKWKTEEMAWSIIY